MRPKEYWFTTKDLVTMAVLSAMGGVVSTYVGYLGRLMNRAVGVPMGAGQFLAGLHVFWIVVAYGLVRKPGAATFVGVLKGVIELLTGSTHGIVVVLISLIQGATFDICMLPVGNKDLAVPNLLAGGLATATNVPVFVYFYMRPFPYALVLVITVLAFCSGVIFAGYFGRSVLESLIRSGVARPRERDKVGRTRLAHKAIAIAFVVMFTAGALYYYVHVFEPGGVEGVMVNGSVSNPYTYVQSDFEGQEVTVLAEMNGTYKHEDPRNYTGVPLWLILEKGSPEGEACSVEIRATDGYDAVFSFAEVMDNDRIIIVEEGDGFRVVAADHDAAYWVRGVVEISVV